MKKDQAQYALCEWLYLRDIANTVFIILPLNVSSLSIWSSCMLVDLGIFCLWLHIVLFIVYLAHIVGGCIKCFVGVSE